MNKTIKIILLMYSTGIIGMGSMPIPHLTVFRGRRPK